MTKSLIITGATGSMGSAAVRAMCYEGYAVIMACRNMTKAEAVCSNILKENPSARLYPIQVDISQTESVRTFAASALSLTRSETLELCGLFNNAGIINRTYRLTDEGYENTLATNFIGPSLLTRLILPHLTDGSHIVNMVSLTCRFGTVSSDLFNRPATKFSQLGTYSDTKLALLLYTSSLNQLLQAGSLPDVSATDIHINVSDPGVVNSNMISMGRWFDPLADALFRPFCKTPESGVLPALHALHSTETGHYFKGARNYPIPSRYTSHPLSDWLWEQTNTIIGQFKTDSDIVNIKK